MRRLLDAGVDRRLEPAEREALFASAFGTTGGPPTGSLIAAFGAAALRDAVATHLAEGTHPLRAVVVAALDSGELVVGSP